MFQKSLFAAIILVCFSLTAKAQIYEFEIDKQAYSSIETPDLIDTLDTAGGVILNFHFPFSTQPIYAFGQVLDGSFSAGANGYVVSTNSTNGFTFDPFLADMYNKRGRSKLMVKELKLESDSVVEVEWYKYGLEDHPEEDYVTFKLRMYKKKRVLEFHYGPSNITKENPFITGQKPIVVISLLSQDFNTVYEQHFFSGDPDDPKHHIFPDFQYASGFPSEGTVYRFVDNKSASVSKRQQHLLSLYPNPSSHSLTVETDLPATGYRIFNSAGQVVTTHSGEASKRFQLSTEALKPGLYTIETTTTDGSFVRKQFQVE